MAFSLKTTGSIWPTCVSARSINLTVRQTYAIILNDSSSESTFANLRYCLGGDRPSQTCTLENVFSYMKISKTPYKGWYLTDALYVLPPMLNRVQLFTIQDQSKGL